MAPHRPTTSRSWPERAGFEPLETRRLLTATVTRGILSIRGTPADDVVEVRRSAADPARFEVVENGSVTLSGPLSGLRQIRIDTGAGNDQALVTDAHGGIDVPTIINGSRGDDLLRGGTGANLIVGGPGRDAFEPGGGRDRVNSATRADRIVPVGSAAAFRGYLATAVRSRDRFGTALGADGIVRTLATTGVAATSTAGAGNAAPTLDGGGFSQTNTQVAGVDEGDIVENDGTHLYALSSGELLIIDARDPDAPAVVSRTAIEGWPIAEYLHAGRLTVLSSVWEDAPATAGAALPLLHVRHAGRVQVSVFDVTDRAAPALVSRTRIDGSYADSRMIDGRLVLVVGNDLLGGYWGGGPAMLRSAAMPVNVTGALPLAPPRAVGDAALVRLVQSSPVARMLPTWTTTPGPRTGGRATSGLVSQPHQILVPASGTEANLTSVVTFDTAGSPRIVGATSIIGGYASLIHLDADALYLFSPRWNAVTGDQTDVQQFTLAAGGPRLLATGTFDGSLLDRFSADAEAGFLRVAVTSTTFAPAIAADAAATGEPEVIGSWLPALAMQRRNAVRILAAQGDTLRVVGSVDDIAPGESIHSARFIGDRAYVCTFLQVDPLFTIDLSLPEAPRIVGELKVPGYSRFLQPFGTGHLVGIGRDADPATGSTTGLKVSLFDVRDDAAPAEVSTYVVEQPETGWSWSDAEWNIHALGFFADVGILALPVASIRPPTVDQDVADVFLPWTVAHEVVVLHIAAAGPITRLGTIAHDSRLLRTTRIGNVVFSLAEGDLHAVQFDPQGTLSPRGTVVLRQDDASRNVVTVATNGSGASA